MVKPRGRKENTMNIEQVLSELYAEHDLVGWKYSRNDRLTTTAGRCKYAARTIELAGWFIDNNSDDEIMLTIKHELAHALTRGHGHDRVWAAKCRALGGNGMTYYTQGDRAVVNPNKTRRRRSSKLYTLECDDCGYTAGRYRRKMTGYRHRGCGGDLSSIELQ